MKVMATSLKLTYCSHLKTGNFPPTGHENIPNPWFSWTTLQETITYPALGIRKKSLIQKYLWEKGSLSSEGNYLNYLHHYGYSIRNLFWKNPPHIGGKIITWKFWIMNLIEPSLEVLILPPAWRFWRLARAGIWRKPCTFDRKLDGEVLKLSRWNTPPN